MNPDPTPHTSAPEPVAYMCPGGCGCLWRDNKDGSMSLYGPKSQSCTMCEFLPLSKLTPLYDTDTSAEQEPQQTKNIRLAAENMDWIQVVLNHTYGPPCFHLEGQRFCGRASTWPGHELDGKHTKIHLYVSFADLLRNQAAAHPRISVESQQAEDEPIKDDDWLALMREIAKVSADAEEWEDAALNDFWQFDPWDALRKLQAKAPATGISVEELAQLSKAAATDILSNCAGKFVHPDLWGEDPQLVMDSQIDRAAKTIRAALAALSQPWGER